MPLKQATSRLCGFIKPSEPLAETLEHVCRGSDRSSELAGYDDLHEEDLGAEEGQEASEGVPAENTDICLARKDAEQPESADVALIEG